VNCQPVAGVDLDNDVEGRGRLAFENGLSRAAAPRFFVRKRDGAHSANQVRKRRVHQEVLQRLAVRRSNQRHASLGNRSGGGRLGLRADLVDHDDLGHVIFYGLDHHRMLQRRVGDLHAPCHADPRVRDVAVAGDFVRAIDDDDALRSSESTRAHSRSIVVLPTPGLPSRHIDEPLRSTSSRISIVP